MTTPARTFEPLEPRVLFTAAQAEPAPLDPAALSAAAQPGDFDMDGNVDADDINLLLADINGPATPAFDINQDGSTNIDDVNAMLFDIVGSAPADANLDGTVDTSDLAILAANFATPGAGWATADFNGDNTVNTSDLAILAANFGFSEPGSTTITAQELGIVGTTPLTASQAIGRANTLGGTDTADTYAISVPNLQSVDILLEGLADGTRVSLLAVNGATVSTAVTTANPTLQLTTNLLPGTYFVSVEPASLGDETAYDLTVTGGPLVPATSLTSGQTVTDAYTFEGEQNFYTINANVGDTLFVSFGEITNSSIDSGVFLYSPSGILLGSIDNLGTGITFSDVLIRETGTYTIVARDQFANATGSYNITATVVDNLVDANNVALASGNTVTADFTLGDIDTYTIDATDGDTLFVSFGEINNSSLDSGVFIYSPSGILLASVDDLSSGASFTDILVRETGTYTIVARDLFANGTGNYSITATVVDNQIDANNVALTSGSTVVADFDLGDIDTYTIDATDGDTLFVSFGEVNTSSIDSGVFIYSPSGILLGSVDDLSSGASFTDILVRETGTYTIVARDQFANGTGNYNITATVIDNQLDANNVALTSGSTVAGDFTLGDIDTYTIEANDGDTLFVNFGEINTSSIDSGVFIYSPSGILLASVDDLSSGASFTDILVRETGTYTILARDQFANGTGNYNITATVVDNQIDANNVALASGNTVAADFTLGDIDTYTIDAAAGEILFVTFEEINTSSIDSGVFIYSPSGILLDSVDDLSSSISFPGITLFETGTYTIVARDQFANGAGNYNITATLQSPLSPALIGLPDISEIQPRLGITHEDFILVA